MTQQAFDHRGSAITGSTPAAREAFEAALACVQSWRGNPEPHIETALAASPQFVMAHVLKAYLLLCSREPSDPAKAAGIVAHASKLAANKRERLHLSALAAALAENMGQARSTLGAILARDQRDVIALHAAHALDYLTGDCACMLERTQASMPAWDRQVPGYPTVLAMHAFALEDRKSTRLNSSHIL